MSCVVGLIENGKIYMGGDSAATCPSTLDRVITKTPKVYKEKDIILGGVGNFRGFQLICDSLDMDSRSQAIRETEDKAKYSFSPYEIVSSIVEDMRNLFNDYGFTEIKDGRENGGYFLIGYKGHLFLIQPEYDITDIAENFYAIGNGDDAARGALYALAGFKDISPQEKIEIALRAAAAVNAAVAPPFVLEEI